MGSAGVGGGSRSGPAEDVVGSERGRQKSADALVVVLFCVTLLKLLSAKKKKIVVRCTLFRFTVGGRKKTVRKVAR